MYVFEENAEINLMETEPWLTLIHYLVLIYYWTVYIVEELEKKMHLKRFCKHDCCAIKTLLCYS